MSTASNTILRPGARATITNLTKRQDLNGRECALLRLHDGRWAVRLTDGPESVRIKPVNLEAILVSLWDRLGGEVDDILTLLLAKLDVAALMELMACGGRLRTACRGAVDARSIRELYSHDRHRAADVDALMRRAWDADGFGADPAASFGHGMHPRTVRAAGQRFRVGDVYFHASSGAFGVVLGWDDRRLAPLSWGRPLPERLYAVHYAVVEFPEPGGQVLLAGLQEGRPPQQRYIVQDSMLAFEDIVAGKLPEGQPATWDCDIESLAANMQLPQRMFREMDPSMPLKFGAEVDMAPTVQRWWAAVDCMWSERYPWAHESFATHFGFLPRLQPSEAWLTTRGIERGLGFMPDAELRAIYPADGPYEKRQGQRHGLVSGS